MSRMEMVGSSAPASAPPAPAPVKRDACRVQFQTFPFAHASKQSHYPSPSFPALSILRNSPPKFFTSSSSSLMFCLNPTSARRTNASNISAIRAESSSMSSGFIPEANFYKVEAILRPWRVPQVSSALLRMGIRGVTVSDVRGFGAQGGLMERQAGSEFAEDNFLAKVKMEIVVSKDKVEAVIDKIIEEARTGEIGDGKIFLVPVADVIRIRTGERGEKAERMMGGLVDMISAESPV